MGRIGVFVRIDSHDCVMIASTARTPTDSLRLRSWSFAMSQTEPIRAIISSVKPTFLVVDGATASNIRFVEEFRLFRCERTVFVTSSGYDKKSDGLEDSYTYAEWSQDELKSAWEFLRDLVWQQEASDDSIGKRLEPVTEEDWASFFSEKFFFAGYSGRWFFKRSITLVKSAVMENIKRLGYVRGDKTENMIACNHLFFVHEGTGVNSAGVVVSVYAQRCLTGSSGSGVQDLWTQIQSAAGKKKN
jgi:hypothetical protein